MAQYPILPFALANDDLIQMYNEVQRWGNTLVQELNNRDVAIDLTPSTTFRTVVTVTSLGRPQKGDIAYSTSSGKFRGYVSLGVETSWQDLN